MLLPAANPVWMVMGDAMPKITLLERQKKNQNRVNVYLDGEFAFGLNELDAVQLHKEQELSDDEVAELRARDAVVQAVDKGIRFLTYRPRSIQEIRRHLTEKDFPDPVVTDALERLETAGYLNDRDFARYWIENRTKFKPLGPKALRYELRQKGVDNAIVEELLAETMDVDAAVYKAAQGQARRLRGTSRRNFQQKLGAFLQRRGFGYASASLVIRQLITELAEADPQFFAEKTTSDEEIDTHNDE
jgi:regulatory protein